MCTILHALFSGTWGTELRSQTPSVSLNAHRAHVALAGRHLPQGLPRGFAAVGTGSEQGIYLLWFQGNVKLVERERQTGPLGLGFRPADGKK